MVGEALGVVAGPQVIGRYTVHGPIAAGGMATVHYGRLIGPAGFSRTVAIKRLRPQFAEDPEFVAMLLDEARLVARIRHPNVVGTLDVIVEDTEILLVMDYVHGESLAQILRAMRARRERVPLAIALRVASDVLQGLHAAHETRDEQGTLLQIVHRDISPQNIMIGADGIARLVDFGVAKAAGRVQHTRAGQLKGKLGYMAPEQVTDAAPTTRQADVHAFATVMWEMLSGQHLFMGDGEVDTIGRLVRHDIPRLHDLRDDVPPSLDEILAQGLAVHPQHRFATARALCLALESCAPMAASMVVGDWVQQQAGQALAERVAVIRSIEHEEGSSPEMSAKETRDAAAKAFVARVSSATAAPVSPPSDVRLHALAGGADATAGPVGAPKLESGERMVAAAEVVFQKPSKDVLDTAPWGTPAVSPVAEPAKARPIVKRELFATQALHARVRSPRGLSPDPFDAATEVRTTSALLRSLDPEAQAPQASPPASAPPQLRAAPKALPGDAEPGPTAVPRSGTAFRIADPAGLGLDDTEPPPRPSGAATVQPDVAPDSQHPPPTPSARAYSAPVARLPPPAAVPPLDPLPSVIVADDPLPPSAVDAPVDPRPPPTPAAQASLPAVPPSDVVGRYAMKPAADPIAPARPPSSFAWGPGELNAAKLDAAPEPTPFDDDPGDVKTGPRAVPSLPVTSEAQPIRRAAPPEPTPEDSLAAVPPIVVWGTAITVGIALIVCALVFLRLKAAPPPSAATPEATMSPP